MALVANALSLARVRVLVADDDPIIRSLIHAQLASRVDDVVEAPDGLSAWNLLLSESFSLALVDLNMPGLDGFNLIRCIRGHPRTKHMPIVVITSRDGKEVVAEAFRAGATSFLTKPISWSLFTHHIDYIVKLAAEAGAARVAAERTRAAATAKDALIGIMCREATGRGERMLELARTLAAARVTPEAPAAALRELMVEASLLQGSFKSLMKHARLITERFVHDDRPTPLRRLLADACREVEALSRARQIEIGIVYAAPGMIVHCDGSAIARAVGNILRNAVAHSVAGSRVELRADVLEDGALMITVADQGVGMDPAFVQRCLMPLAQIEHEPAGAGASLGLGIPLAKSILEAHGGRLEIRSMRDDGTTVALLLPGDRVELDGQSEPSVASS
jgi:CheY-like chemotaxis protein